MDHKAEIIMTLYASEDDIEMLYNETNGEYYVRNILTDTVPCIIHGNGRVTRPFLHDISRYLASNFKHDLGQKIHPKWDNETYSSLKRPFL